jgi:hypothetical protein
MIGMWPKPPEAPGRIKTAPLAHFAISFRRDWVILLRAKMDKLPSGTAAPPSSLHADVYHVYSIRRIELSAHGL